MEMGMDGICHDNSIIFHRLAGQNKWLMNTTDAEKCPTNPEPEADSSGKGFY